MVYSPRFYLVSAAVATVMLKMQQASAASMYYTTQTTSKTANELSANFPGAGCDVPDEHTKFTVNIDPTLPDVTMIPTVPVTNPEFLTNATSAPNASVHTVVGTPLVSVDTPFANVNSPSPSTFSKGGRPTDCATGWDASTRKLETVNDGGSNTNKDIQELEAFFGVTIETKLENLPKKSQNELTPWGGPYWPTYQDSINIVWSAGDPSPAAKYATAFDMDAAEFMNKVSAKHGIDSRTNAQQCTDDTQCAGGTSQSACAKREGSNEGRCIPTWFGICHAWSGAAISEPEPECPVTHNGVTFQPLDLKGLISVIYDDTNVGTVFTGARFRSGNTDRDEFGRPMDPTFRDINAGFFHIATTNILGLLKSTFIVDVTAGLEVWNQPVRSYKVKEMTAMSLEEAAQTFYGLDKYPWNEAAKSIVYVKTRLSWIVEANEDGPLVSSGRIDEYTNSAYYYYLLELDDDGKIIGGEWVYDSDVDHPDFMWLIRTKPAADAMTSTGVSYKEVSMLLEKSAKCSNSEGDENTEPPATGGSESAPPITGVSGGEPPASEVPQNETPVFEAPQNETPVFEAPQNETPVFEAPQNETPVFEAPQNEAPSFGTPQNEAPSFGTPQNEAPSFETPTNDGGHFQWHW